MSRDGLAAFLAVPRGCLQFVIVVFPDHTHLLFLFPIFFNNEENPKVSEMVLNV